MKKTAVLLMALLFVVMSPVFAQANLKCSGGSFGWYQTIDVVPGALYNIDGFWKGSGTNHWMELLFFNDDGRPIYDQLDAPHNSSVILKVDGWGMNGEDIPDWESFREGGRYYQSGPLSNVITATGTRIYVGLKVGASGGNVDAWFADLKVGLEDNMLVNGDFSQGEYGWTRWGAPGGIGYEWNVVPEPSSVAALAGMLASSVAFIRRRKSL